MSQQTVVLKVGMSCQGCVGAVKRVLGKLEGVEYDIDLKEQKVTVKGNVEPDVVLQTVAKTGKKTAFWEAEAPAEPENKPSVPENKPSVPENKPSEPENKPFETENKPFATENKPSETENKPSETVAVA